MTTPPITDQDLSAVIDGDADEATVARVEADPTARQRLDAMRATGEALRNTSVPELDPDTVDTLIGRAIAEGHQTETTASPDDADTATVTPLAPPRSTSTTGPRWLAAAAIVVLVAVGLALVWSGTRSNDEDTASVASTQAESSAGQAEETSADAALPEDSVGEAPATTGAPAAIPPGPDPDGDSSAGAASELPLSLGSYATIDDLRTALRDDFPDGAPSTTDIARNDAAIERCDLLMQEVFSLPGAAQAVGIAEVAGADLIVYEYEAPSQRDGSPTTFVTANEPDSCNAQLSFERTTG